MKEKLRAIPIEEKVAWTSPEILCNLLDNSFDGILAFDCDFRISLWNQALERMIGIPKNRALGKSIFDSLTFLDQEAVHGELSNLIKIKSYHFKKLEFSISERDQQLFLEFQSFALTDSDGHIVGGMGLLRDVTEQKLTKLSLEESEHRFQTMANCAPVMLWMSGLDGKCDFFNKTWLEFSGRTLEQEFGDGWAEGIHPEDFQGCVDAYMEAFRSRTTFQIEYRLRRHDGKYRWILDRGAPRYSPDEKFLGFIGSCVDVSDFKEVAHSLENANIELQKLTLSLRQSNQDLERFAYAASHDLQEPLRSVASYAQLLQRRYQDKLDKQANEFIGYLVGGVERMKSLVEGLLALAQVEKASLNMSVISSEDALQDAIHSLQNLIEKRHVELTHDSLPRVKADRRLLTEVFQNLINNAIKYCGEKNPQIHISAKRDRGQIVFSCSDNGIGISQEHRDRIFQIFSRLHSRARYPGSGMGLAICKRIVEAHQGEIWFEARPGGGTTFFFSLPGLE